MELNKIKFNSIEDDGAYPSKITITISIEEAIWIATIAGKQKGISPHNDIYRCLVSDVFNRYWEDGLQCAYENTPVETPPINYDN